MLGCEGLRIKAQWTSPNNTKLRKKKRNNWIVTFHFWKASQIWTQQVKTIFNVFSFVTILVKGKQKIKQICLKLNTTFS